MQDTVDWISKFLTNDTLQTWGIAVAIMLGTTIGLRLLKGFVVTRLRRFTDRTQTAWDDVAVSVLDATHSGFYLGVGLWLGSEYVELGREVHKWLRTAAMVLTLVQLGLWLQAGVGGVSAGWKAKREKTTGSKTMASAVAFISKLLIWSVLVICVLSTLGFEISALIAGLGVGGVAAALAVQSVLGDVFASLSIYFDRPFDLGDFIVVGDEMGTVERVGLRTTRVRALGGEQIVFANGDLTDSRIHNYGRMLERRVVFSFGVEYGTSPDKLESIPGWVREVVEQTENVRFDRAHFHEYGDFALLFEVVFYVLSPDYNEYMDRRQSIHLSIFRKFSEQGVSFAFPTRTLHVRQFDKSWTVRSAPEQSTSERGNGKPAQP